MWIIGVKVDRVVHDRFASGCTDTADERASVQLKEVASQLECVKEELLQSTSETNAVKERLSASEQNSSMLNKTLEEVQVRNIHTL